MFTNEPVTGFAAPPERQAFLDALGGVNQAIKTGKLFAKPIINGIEIDSKDIIERVDPSDTSIVVGRTALASAEDALRALHILKNGETTWAETDPVLRASIIRKAGELMRTRKRELAALIVREAGKPWKEADGDVGEAIDFCIYYALEMERLSKPRKTMEVPGEDSFYFYEPKGVSVVIAPWNFPLAIACGMTVASLVTGNVTILKPAAQTSIIAYEFAKILLEAGIPKDAFAFIPARGSVVGKALVENPLVDLICFTGSKDVGLWIIHEASEVKRGQRNVKRVIAEMGGKNCIIVDSDADLDEAVKGVLTSAFGFAGQKCSACSRLVVVGNVYESFILRLCEAASDIIVGNPTDSATFLGPVIDKAACERIKGTISEAERKHNLAFQGKVPTNGYFVPATIFKDVDTKSALWQEEIFGPVLAATKANSFEEALTYANDSQYALTGAVFSRSPKNIELAQRKFKVGNLYINRGSTGALVGRHPFGGSKMSGVGSKAGGPDYLLQFLDPRTVTENTMRRGFSPT